MFFKDYTLSLVNFLSNLLIIQTINDVFLGVTSAGLSRYLNRRQRHGEIFMH